MNMLALYTPATGFPDLEVKIAYGLARVGIEAGYKFKLIPNNGYYSIEFQTNDLRRLISSFLTILKRLLSSDRFFDLGVKAKDKSKYSADEKITHRLETFLKNADILELFSLRSISNLNIKKDMFCGHTNVEKFGGRSGLILISSFHAGKPYARDKRFTTFNQSLCAVCGYLAVLGLYSFGFKIEMGQRKNPKYIIVLPMPQKPLSFENLQMLLSLQKALYGFWLSDLQPLNTFTVGLLGKAPSLSDIINDLQLNFHLSIVSKDNRGDTVVEHTESINALPFSKFISYSSYNSALVTKLLDSLKNPPRVASLIEITNMLEHFNRTNIFRFARLYVQETSPKKGNWVNLLYPETAKYLLKEVAMINPDIIEDPAIGSLASTLRYFIRERKYGYADDIRNARKESRDFEETIAKMLREGELRRIQQEQERSAGKEIKNWIHLPTPEEIKKVFRLANDDFESTKLALVILAFSFPSKAEEIDKPIEKQ